MTVSQDGHILAVEYLEETPLLLGRPGMGLKLNTFYRRKHERDAGHLDIRKGPRPRMVMDRISLACFANLR